jgi:nucleoid-associated protein YgaU
MALQTITVIGGDLMLLAAQYLGDPLQWTRIASLNGLFDPKLPNASITLTIPSPLPNSTQTGVLGWTGTGATY